MQTIRATSNTGSLCSYTGGRHVRAKLPMIAANHAIHRISRGSLQQQQPEGCHQNVTLRITAGL